MKLFLQLLACRGASQLDKAKRAELWCQACVEEQNMARALLEAYTIELHSLTVRAGALATLGEDVLGEIRTGVYPDLYTQRAEAKQKVVQKSIAAQAPLLIELQEKPASQYEELVKGLSEVQSAKGIESYLDQLENDIDNLLNSLT